MSEEHLVQSMIIWALTVLMSCVLYSGLYTQNQTTQRIAAASLTQQVCMQAHGVNDGVSEKACGDLQDKYNLEFLCKAGACWTEVK